MSRPEQLPDFLNPPLDEVVLGVQFAPAAGYSQIRTGEVWALFRDEFPDVEEQQPLPPTFETFGLPQQQTQLRVVTGANHDRFWFVSPTKAELIQFQHDRLLHNWRKVGDGMNVYPRFERMIERFQGELETLERYFASLASQSLKINQVEVTYVNKIFSGDQDSYPEPEEWLNFLTVQTGVRGDFKVIFRQVITDADEKPIGRFICDAGSAMDAAGRRVLMLSLSVRGAPKNPDLSSALGFIRSGREKIVESFAKLTTSRAHVAWERVK